LGGVFRGMGRFSVDENGRIVDQLVSIILVVLVVGGLFVTILMGMERIWSAARLWFCEAFSKVCS
jgi:vacuolar-type H+-ATPase subunit I/STV1